MRYSCECQKGRREKVLGIIGLFVLLIGLVGLVLGIRAPKPDPQRYGMSDRGLLLTWGGIASGIGLVLVSFASFTSVDEGEVHVPILFGEALEPITQKGLQFKNPLASIVTMPTRTVEVTFEGEGVSGDTETETNLREINALTSEGAQVAVDMTVLYHVDPTQTDVVYATVGTRWEEVLVLTRARNTARDCLPRYTFEEGRTAKRGEALHARGDAIGPRPQRSSDRGCAPSGHACGRSTSGRD